MGWIDRLFGRTPDRPASALYDGVVAIGRREHWYLEGNVADTVDGRFDMIAAVLSMVILRLEKEPAGAVPAAALTERFVEDMDGQLRQIGIGDIMVGKHIGRMMGMLGGRLGAYRDGVASLEEGVMEAALVRNLYRGVAPPEAALRHVVGELRRLRAALAAISIDDLTRGTLP